MPLILDFGVPGEGAGRGKPLPQGILEMFEIPGSKIQRFMMKRMKMMKVMRMMRMMMTTMRRRI